jgi:fibro-slime domain-containing protein
MLSRKYFATIAMQTANSDIAGIALRSVAPLDIEIRDGQRWYQRPLYASLRCTGHFSRFERRIDVYRFTTVASALLLISGSIACSAGDDAPGAGSGGSGAGGPSSGSGGGGGSILGPGKGTAGGGGGLNVGNGGGTNNGEGCESSLAVTFRDFKGSGEPGGHPDFELSATITHEGKPYKGWNDVGCGLVEPAIGAGNKPVFYSGPAMTNGGVTVPVGAGQMKRVVSGPGCWTPSNQTPTGICNVGTCTIWDFAPPTAEIKSATTFNQWYTTADGVNMEVKSSLALDETAPGSGVYVYDSNAFFPLDGQGFGNTPGQTHNFHFTTEANVTFRYETGQKFTFRGDDDLWIFVNGKLALDVGGLHQALEGTIDFDAQAATLGITPGSRYRMDIFHAERQTLESNFRIETNISCFEPVVVE